MLEQPPRVIGQTGELKEEAVKEILKWVAPNKEELINVWEGSVDEKRAQFIHFDVVKVAANLLKQPQNLIAQPGGDQMTWQPELRLSSALLTSQSF